MTSNNVLGYAQRLYRVAIDFATLSEIDGHAQTDGSLLSNSPIATLKRSSKRAAKKLAIGLMSF